jgi:hypothetical protein
MKAGIVIFVVLLTMSIAVINAADLTCRMSSEVRFPGFVSHDDFDKFYQFHDGQRLYYC